MVHRTKYTWTCLCFAAMVFGCDDQPGTESSSDPGQGTMNQKPRPEAADVGKSEPEEACILEISEFDASQQLPNGVLASTWISQLQIDRNLKVKLPKNAKKEIVLEPNSEGQGVRIQVQALPGPIKHVSAKPRPVPKGVKGLPAPCPDYYAFDVQLLIKSDDGAIDGRWKTTATRLDALEPDPDIFEDEDLPADRFDYFRLQLSAPQTEMQGSLKASVPSFQEELENADSTKETYSLWLHYAEKARFDAQFSLNWEATRIVKKSKKHPGHNIVSTSSAGGPVYAFGE